MFNFRKKTHSLSQLKRKRRDINKAIEITNGFSLKMIFIGIAFIIASISINIGYGAEFLALINHQEVMHRDIMNILYASSSILQFMGLGLALSATLLWGSNIGAYRALRKIPQTIEALSVREDIPHAK